MLYTDGTKRYILYFFKKGFEFGLSEEEIIKNLPEIPGSNEDKKILYNDCKAYLFLDAAFINHPPIAITLAEKYINNHTGDVNLIDEKLFTMYIKNNQLELANNLLEKLLEKDPNNRWTISKKINMLKSQRKYSEALAYIKEKYEIIKYDPSIFDIQYKLLYKSIEKNPEALIKLFKRIPSLNLGFDIEKRNDFIKKLKNYLGKTYPLQEKVKNPKDIIYIRKIIKEKIKTESEKTSLLATKKPNTPESFVPQKKDDLQIIQEINFTIKNDRNNSEKLDILLKSLENDLIRFYMECQISHSQGKKSKDLAEKIKVYSKKNSSSLDDISKKTTRVLINLLTGSMRNLYLHDEWLRFQKQYFNVILTPNEPKKETDKSQEKTSEPSSK